MNNKNSPVPASPLAGDSAPATLLACAGQISGAAAQRQ
jgi:hypothetical protein